MGPAISEKFKHRLAFNWYLNAHYDWVLVVIYQNTKKKEIKEIKNNISARIIFLMSS